MPDEGWINIGETVNLGYFAQEVEPLPSTATILSSVREIAEYIDVGVGRERYISARELCDRFGFSAKQQNAYVQTLSGGERRRLALLRVLMSNPNVLFLDEPTNDFDIVTLNALEDYLQYFKGVLLIVSHDRAFLDKTVTTIWSFEANQRIKEFPGNYSDYLEKTEIRNGNKSEPRAAQEQDRKPRATGTGTDSSDLPGNGKEHPGMRKKCSNSKKKSPSWKPRKPNSSSNWQAPLHITPWPNTLPVSSLLSAGKSNV
ncbi:MAG: ABC transporter ATP-binding protein [Chlorobi bacterium OLB6]|nr:MAG: ABC transporter ATP-binding protein [Chlorobi bacterium OLB6]